MSGPVGDHPHEEHPHFNEEEEAQAHAEAEMKPSDIKDAESARKFIQQCHLSKWSAESSVWDSAHPKRAKDRKETIEKIVDKEREEAQDARERARKKYKKTQDMLLSCLEADLVLELEENSEIAETDLKSSRKERNSGDRHDHFPGSDFPI